MNRITKVSRRYEGAKPMINNARNKRRLARRLAKLQATDPTKTELLKMATLLGIKGRSSMNKAELFDAVVQAGK